jgi:hypothetical protein
VTKKAKLALIAALAVTRLAATPAFGQSFDQDDGTGNVLPLAYQSTAPDPAARHAGTRAARRNGLDALAMERRQRSNFAPRIQTPADSDDPAITGGGSVGYNQLLKEEP